MALVPLTDASRLKEGVRRFWSGFTTGQKVTTVAAAIVVLVAAVAFMSLSGRPTYVPLFTNLSAKDAAAITQQLTTDKVPFQLEDGGATILVPANDVATERLKVAEAGLPTTGTVGLSILDKEGITTSQLAQQADYLRALQGELESTIDAISGVTSSVVNIAIPANNTFALTTENPTGASVLVDLSPGAELTPGQVQAIVHLVASSVPGLSASDVTVADNNGDLLAGPGVTNEVGSEDGATAAYDSAVAAKIESFLASVLGPGNADVQVNAQLDFGSTTTKKQLLVAGPGGTVNGFCTSTSQSTETFNGNGAGAGGPVGSVTLPPGLTGTSNYQKTTTDKTCEAGTEQVTETTPPGSVKDQSVAVLVNAKALPRGVNLASLRAGVAAAANLVPSRGDVLSFSAVPFSTAAAQAAKRAEQQAAEAAKRKALVNEAKDGLLVLALVAVLFLLWRSARRLRAEAFREIVTTRPPSLDVLEPPTGELPAVAAGALARDRAQPGADVNEFIDRQPEEVATMLRSWMRSEEARA